MKNVFKLTKSEYELFVKIANSEEGRFLLAHKDNKKIVGLEPNAYFTKEGKKHLTASFYPGNVVFDKLYLPFLKGLILDQPHKGFLHYAGFEKRKFPAMSLSVAAPPINPSAGEQNARNSDTTTWAAVRGAANSSFNGTVTEVAATKNGALLATYRAFEPFVTSVLGLFTVPESSNLQAYRDDSLEAGGNGFANPDATSIEMVKSTQASVSSYATSDFAALTFVSIGTLNFSATSNGAYFTITMTDLTAISVTGNTKLALITGRDLNNNAPTGNNYLTFQNRIQANPVKLNVSFSPGGNFAGGII